MVYVFDTSSLRIFENYYPESFPKVWDRLADAVLQGSIKLRRRHACAILPTSRTSCEDCCAAFTRREKAAQQFTQCRQQTAGYVSAPAISHLLAERCPPVVLHAQPPQPTPTTST